ncbi:MAG: fatty acid desaturase [Planctomycetaceae bacterium]|nr:fatty acid desaturase [Planctomycetaceae bacterium]
MTRRAEGAAETTPGCFNQRAVLAQYRTPHGGRGIGQLLATIVPFVLLWAAMWYSLRYSYAVTLLLSVPTAGLLVRLYILQHDCGHGSLFRSKRWNDVVGRVLAVMVFTPYQAWKSQHAQHHATAGDLDRRGMGDVQTMTLNEYQRLTLIQRLCYRIYRNPLFVFGIAPLFYFAARQRFTWGLPPTWKKERASVYWTNLAILIVIAGLCWLLGWREFLLVHVPVAALASSAGVWLFYVQHNFEETYWERHEHWDFETAGLHGSSYYQLPRPLQWMTANIGFHHIHHLDSRIPNYRLQECYDAHPEFQNVHRLTLRQSLACTRVKLWDEERRQMVGFPRRVPAAKSPPANRQSDRHPD